MRMRVLDGAPLVGAGAVIIALAAFPAGAVTDGTALTPLTTQHLFGGAVGVGNTLAASNGQINEVLLPGGSEATITTQKMDPDATVVQAFLVWSATFDPASGVPLDKNADFTLPNGQTFTNLSINAPVPGETLSPLNACTTRNHQFEDGVTLGMFECRRDVTFLLQQLGAGGAIGTYGVDNVNAFLCTDNFDERCQAGWAGWGIVVLWQSPTEPVKRDLVVYDGFWAVDEQSDGFGPFSPGVSPSSIFDINGFTIGPTADGEITFLAWEGDAQLGVPPQNLFPQGDPLRCNDGKCVDSILVHTNTNATNVALHDAANPPGNLLNGSDNAGGGPHPGVDIDTFDLGPGGLNVLKAGDTHLFVQPISGDGVQDDGSGGSGELFILGMTLVSVDTFAPRFANNNTEKVVLEPVAGDGETLHYILRVGNDGSASATNVKLRDQLPSGVAYVPGSTTNTCGVTSGDVGGTSPVLQGTGLNVGTLAINAHCEVRFNVTIDNAVPDGTLLQNFFTVAADGVPPILIGPANTQVQAAQLGTPTKTVSVSGGGQPSQGSTLVYDVHIPNPGQRNAPNVSLVDNIPAQLQGLQVLSFPSGATNSSTATQVNITNITIPAGGAVDVVFQATIKQGTATGTQISNQGSVNQPSLQAPLLTDDPSTAAPRDPTVITVASGISLAGSSKTAVDVNGGRFQPGDTVRFTVHVNKSGTASTVIDVSDSLPLHMNSCAVVSVPAGAFANCSAGGANGDGQVNGSFAVASGSVVGDFVFTAVLDANAPDGFSLVNTAHLSPEIDTSFAVDVSSAPLVVFARPDFTTSTKTVNDLNGGDPRPNDILAYTITVTNSGSIPATNLVVTDAVPSQLVNVVAADGGAVAGAAGAQSITWSAGSLAVGASITFHFSANIAPLTPDGTRISNSALVHADAPAQDFTTPPAVVTVKASPTFAVTKTVSDLNGPPFRPGDVVRYSIVVSNSGDGVGTNVVVRDTIDPSFSQATTNNGGRVVGGDVVFDSSTVPALSSIAPGASITLTFDAQLQAVIVNGTIVSNQAFTTSTQVTTPVPSDDPATAAANDPTRFSVTSQAVLAMKKTFVDDNAGALLPGDTVTYTLAVDDTGNAPATGVVVTDALDARLTFVASADGGAVSGTGAGGAGGIVTFPAKNVVPGTTTTLRFQVRVAAGLSNGTTIPNQASATSPVAASTISDDPSTGAPNDPTVITVVSRPVFDTTTKTVVDTTSSARFTPGDHVRYTITIPNTGSENGTGVVVTDAVPAALVNIVPGQGGAVTSSGGAAGGATVQWNLGTVNVGATVTLTVDADIKRPLADATVVDNQASVSGTNFTTIVSDDPSTAAPQDPTRFVVTSKPHLVVQKTVTDVNGGVVAPGDTLVYAITLRSDGGRDAQSVTLTDVVDAHFTNVVAQDGGVLSAGGAGNSGTITWSFADLAIDTTTTLHFKVDVKTPEPNGTLVPNQASAALAEANVPGAPFPSDDPNTAAPNDPTVVQVISASDLSATTLSVVDVVGGAVIHEAAPGATVRYQIIVQNRGNDDGRDVTVALPIPPQLDFVTSSGGAFAGGVVRFDKNATPALADVAPGARVTLTVDVHLKNPQPTTPAVAISTQATLTSTGSVNPFKSDDPSTGAANDATVLDVVALSLTKDVAGGRTHAPGDVLAYTITATSIGSTSTQAGAAITDVVAAALTNVTPGPGLTFNAATRTLSGSIGALASGARATFAFSATIPNNTTNGTRISNQADVRGNDFGDVLSDDPATAGALGDPTVVVVNSQPVLSTSTKVATDVDGAPLLPGDTVRYVISVVNSGTGVASDVRVTDVVDAQHLQIVNVENGGTSAGNTIVWANPGDPALAVVARGATTTVAFTAKVLTSTTNGTVIANQAQIITRDIQGTTLTDDPSTPAPNDPTNVTVTAPVINVKKKIVDLTTHANGALDFEPNDVIEYRIEVDNVGGLAATGVIVSDPLPATGLVSVSPLDGGVDDAGLVTWTIPRLNAGASALVRVRATIDPLAVGGTVLSNQASVTANEIGTPVPSDDPDTTASGDATTRTVTASEKLTGTITIFDIATGAQIATSTGAGGTGTTGTVVPHQRVRVHIDFANGGNQVAQAVVLKVPLSPLRVVVDSTTGGGVIDNTGVRWDASQNPAFAKMSTGQGASVEFTGSIASPIPDNIDIPVAGLLTDAATPTPVTIGPATMHVKSRPDLSATTKEVVDDNGGLVEPGDVLTYRITVLNAGGALAHDVHVVDNVPGGMVYVANSTKVRGQHVADATLAPGGGAGVGGSTAQPPTSSLNTAGAAAGAGQGGLAIGDVDAGRSVVVEFKVRVTPQAPRGLRIDNQAVLHATGAPDAVSDFPGTPLIVGDATPVVVGGGPSLIAAKSGAPSPVAVGQTLRFDIHVENVGTDPATNIEINDTAPAGTKYVPRSLLVDNIPATDALDRDDADADIASGRVHLKRASLEAGQGLTLSFSVKVQSGAVIVNQAQVSSANAGSLVTDGDPSVSGDQPTVIPVKNARAILIDGDSTTLTDDNGGVLNAGDAVTVRATIRNRSLEHVVVDSAEVDVSAELTVDPTSITDTRFTFDANKRGVVLKAGQHIDVEDGGAVDVVFPAKVSAQAKIGDGVRALAKCHAHTTDNALQQNVDLGRAELTVGLLPGTAAINGTLFLAGGAPHDAFTPSTDKPAQQITVLAFWRDQDTPVQTAISDSTGHYQLLPIPAGTYRLELRSPGGAFFGDAAQGVLKSGEVRAKDISVVTTGAVYVSGTEKAAEGSRVFLFADNGNDDPNDDAQLPDRQLATGQQGQEVGPQGLYRFDPPPGKYRIQVETPDPLTSFPSAAVPVQKDTRGNPFGAFATPDQNGEVVKDPLPDPVKDTTYFLRFNVARGPPLTHDFIPVDTLKSELAVTKTANRKRASVGDIISYSVRVDNRALTGVSTSEGGVELVDTLPFGFELVKGSYELNRITTDAKGQQTRNHVAVKDKGGAVHTFGPFEMLPSASYELRYNVVVGPGATNGPHENRAKLRLAAGQVPLTQDAIAAVEIVPDGTFDLGTIRAKIFCDDNKNQWQDAGELGLPGVRMVVDTGQWIDSDIDGKAHFSAIPAGMHVVKIDEATVPPGTTLDHIRETFYMSTGMPAEVEFYAHCAFVKNNNAQVTINEDAYKPDDVVPAKKHHVEGKASPAKLVVDGTEVAIAQVELGLGVEGENVASASDDGAGPNLPSVVDGALKPKLVLSPKITSAPDAPIAWQIVIEALGLPAPASAATAASAQTSTAPAASQSPKLSSLPEPAAIGLLGGLDALNAKDPKDAKDAKDAKPMEGTVAVDPLAKARAVWVFAGQGAPPPSIAFDGKDPATGSEVLFEHQLYRATLSVGFDDGARASSAGRVFGVRAGIVDGDATAASIDVDSEGGELFDARAKPTPKLNAWLGEHAAELKGKKITVVVHSDAPNTEALTDKVAMIVRKALVAGYGLDGANITTKGAGDTAPKVPNLRKKDRAKNRRVEILVEKHEEKIPALAPPLSIAPAVSMNGASIASEDGSFTTDVQAPEGTALALTFTSPTGAQTKIVRGEQAASAPVSSTTPSAKPEAKPVAIVWRPAEHRLLVDDKEIAVPLLDVKLAAKAGALVPSSASDVASWTVRVFNAKPDAPAEAPGASPSSAADDSAIGPVAREINGDGKLPSEIPFDGLDANGVKIDHPRARLIVKLANGDTGTSPDVDVNAASTVAGAANVETIKDPIDANSALKPEAVATIKALAASAKAATSVRIEVHSDDEGPRLDRRTKTQNAAEVMKMVLVKEGVPADRITALGMGSDVPLLPNIDRKARAKNRRAEITITQAASAPPMSTATAEPGLYANGVAIAAKDGSLAGAAAPSAIGEVVLDLKDASGARALLHVKPGATVAAAPGSVWQGDVAAFESWVATVAPLDVVAPTSTAPGAGGDGAQSTAPVPASAGASAQSTASVPGSNGVGAQSAASVPASGGAIAQSAASVPGSNGVGALATGALVPLTPAKPPPQPPPAWYPDANSLPANDLVVDLPADITKLKSDTLLVRGHTSPENRVRIGLEEVPVDDAGNFVTVAKLPEGDSVLVVEATDPFGNTGTIKRDVNVDTTGWFTLLLADTAFGGDGADLGERTPYTSLKLGDTFIYGRGAAFVHGRWHGATLFQNYDLVLDVDTRRWQDDIFDPELIDPERFFPVYGDSAAENVDATRSAFPVYLNLRADNSSLMVGAVRTELNDGSLFRYTRARSGAQLTFDRGWSTPLEVDPKAPPPPPDADPWRSRVTAFVAGGGGQQHTRVEMMGTGSSVYFLKDQLIVEGSEEVNLIVRDAVTGAEIARTPQVRDVDYSIRYDEGRIMFKEPISAFADGELTVNQNLGQVANQNRVFVEVEYEHQDDQTFSGISAGGDVKQIVFGHAEVGGGYVYEGREGITAYQLGGGHLRLFQDQNTWIQAELLGSQSVDAANFLSTDGGLTYQSLGQSLDQKDVRVGQKVFPAEREGLAFKLEGNAQLGQWLGRKENSDANVHGYVAEIQPGFFADSSIVEQGETKWGTEGAWQVFDDGKFKLRYDGVIAEVPDIAPEAGFGTPDSGIYRTLHREIAVAHYEQKLVPSLTGIAEYGFGYTWDSGSFGPSAFAQSRDFVTNDVAAGVDWQVIEPLTLSLKQEYLITGDPEIIHSQFDRLITHLAAKYALTESVSLLGGTDFRWSGENQVHAGVSWAVNDQSRVYLAERVGLLPAPVTGTMGWGATTVVGGEEDITPGSTAYAEYQLDGGFAGEQSRGVVGLKTVWKLPFGFALNFGYERIMLIGANIPTTEAGNVPPGAFTDGTFYQAPGANEGGSYLAGQGSRDAVSAALEFHRGETIVASQRLELRYDNQDESRGGHDLLWMLSGTAAAVRFSPEVSVLGRYNIALAQDLTLSARDAYFEEGALGVAYRPITHDWFSLLAKVSRRVDERPLSLEDGTSDNYTAHAISIEPIMETPWKVQLVEKLALKHSSEKLDDVPEADAVTALSINRLNIHTLGLLKSLGVDQPVPGEIDLGLEFRVLDTLTTGALQLGPLLEVQVAPVEYFRIGVGYNFTHFSDDELDSGKLDRQGFFVRAVGSF